MANALQLRRGTTTQHSTFTGLAGEVTVDTDKETIVVHDGSTAGGFPLALESDITAASLLTSIKTVDGAASGLDADTVDGKQLATIESEYQAYADSAAAGIVDSAPSTLDTLNELAAALGDDPNFATTVTNSIATKLPLAGGTITGNVTFNDNIQARFGGSADAHIRHDGVNFSLTNNTGNFLYYSTGATDHVFHTNGVQRLKIRNAGIQLVNSASIEFSDGSTQTSAGASTGKAIAMAIVFG